MPLDKINGKIRVYNYSTSPVGFPSQHNQQGVFLRGRSEDEEYVVERVAFDDIEAENSKSDLFKVGRLRFHPDEENEIYELLGIEDRENIMDDKELAQVLMDDSLDNLKRISKINSMTLITRMKSMLFVLERSGKNPPHNTVEAVTERLNELKNGGKRIQNSVINRMLEEDKKRQEETKLQETVKDLVKQVEMLKKQNEEKDEIIVKSQTAIHQLLDKVETLISVPKTKPDTLLESKETKNETKDEKKSNKAPNKSR
ncbi:hypothetical protein EDM57_05170 [Brevibacillus gelatini]|uniref:Uncharacterized protein n=1 Tax=Brevibacillus gelatini TaxID=1655277 RepID=A0A3M8B7V4_9BACL|nr:hypothetical protein [Brevibacillus gelatini]RNB59534.1 hypothetical protein EDM57_05170 [Brevibacillus gelatini]